MKEFKAFVLRGNVVDLAVGVIIGAAFAAIVTSMVTDVFTPLLGLLNIPDFADRTAEIGGSTLRWGKFVNALIGFLTTAAILFFFVVKPTSRFMAGGKQSQTPKMRECPHCLSSIRAEATACAHCTRDVPAAAHA